MSDLEQDIRASEELHAIRLAESNPQHK